MVEIEWPDFARHVRHYVFVMNHAPLIGKLFVRERSIFVITDTRLTEINHLINLKSFLDQSHSCQLSDSSTETVASNFDISFRILFRKSFNVFNDLIFDGIGSFLKTFVDGAVALWPFVIMALNRVEVGHPVFDPS